MAICPAVTLSQAKWRLSVVPQTAMLLLQPRPLVHICSTQSQKTFSHTCDTLHKVASIFSLSFTLWSTLTFLPLHHHSRHVHVSPSLRPDATSQARPVPSVRHLPVYLYGLLYVLCWPCAVSKWHDIKKDSKSFISFTNISTSNSGFHLSYVQYLLK